MKFKGERIQRIRVTGAMLTTLRESAGFTQAGLVLQLRIRGIGELAGYKLSRTRVSSLESEAFILLTQSEYNTLREFTKL